MVVVVVAVTRIEIIEVVPEDEMIQPVVHISLLLEVLLTLTMSPAREEVVIEIVVTENVVAIPVAVMVWKIARTIIVVAIIIARAEIVIAVNVVVMIIAVIEIEIVVVTETGTVEETRRIMGREIVAAAEAVVVDEIVIGIIVEEVEIMIEGIEMIEVIMVVVEDNGKEEVTAAVMGVGAVVVVEEEERDCIERTLRATDRMKI